MLPLSISSSLPGETDPTKPYGALPSVNADFAPVSTRGNIAQGAAFFFFFFSSRVCVGKVREDVGHVASANSRSQVDSD